MQDEPSIPEDYDWVTEEVRSMASKIGPVSSLIDTLVWEMRIVKGEKWMIQGVSDEEPVCQVPP